MARIVLMLLMCLCSALSAWISDPVAILNEDARVMFAGESGVVYKNGNIYLTYLQKGETHNYVMLSKSFDRGNTFVHTLVDSVIISDKCFAPALSVNSTNTCFVYYQELIEHPLQSSLTCAKVLTNNSIFYSQISSDILQTPLLLRDDTYTTVFFRKQAMKQLCNFVYFSNLESSNLKENPVEGRVCFWGPDVIDGPLHTNGNLYIRNGGGGNNDGWPTFMGQINLGGVICTYNGGAIFPNPPCNPEDVFPGGYIEKFPRIEIEKEFPSESYFYPFGQDPSSNRDIVKVEIIGNVATFRTGDITEGEVRPFTVYSSYPDAQHPTTPIGDSLWTNYITIKDTIWTDPTQFTIPQDRVVYVPATLWIKGHISGKQMWRSTQSAYLIGDITYMNTPIGSDPVNNTTDYFSLISDKSIFLKYKYRIDGEPFSCANSNGPTAHVYIYGAFAALGNSDPNPDNNWREDGVFTYEYQHPHGAPTDFYGISPFTGADTLFTFIDFHKYQFPPTATTPYWKKWPYGDDVYPGSSYPIVSNTSYPWYGTTDWPWINPVWPEKRAADVNDPNPLTETVYERGVLNLWGSIAQIRRGFMHRSGIVNADSPDQGAWDPANYKFGSAHPSTGYEKNYRFDQRFSTSPFPHYANYLAFESKPVSIKYDSNGEIVESDSLQTEQYYTASFISKDNANIAEVYTLAGCDSIFCKFSSNNGESYIDFNLIPGEAYYSRNAKVHDFKLKDNVGYLMVMPNENNIRNLVTIKIDFNEHEASFWITSIGNASVLFTGQKSSLTLANDGSLLISYQNHIYVLGDSLDSWFSQEQITDNPDIRKSTMVMDESDSLFLFVSSTNPEENLSQFDKLYFCKGYLDGITPVTDHPIPAVEPFYVKNYPNPFNPSTTIEFNLPAQVDTKLEIFNIKGQKVSTLLNSKMEKGLHKVVWNGTNSADKSVGSGIYFYKLAAGNNIKIQKILMIK